MYQRVDQNLSDSQTVVRDHLLRSPMTNFGVQPGHAVIAASVARAVFSEENPKEPQVKLDHLESR
jgi:hypothetical protein